MFTKKKNNNLLAILIITICALFRIQDFNNGFWYDEWTTLWFSSTNYNLIDPNNWSYLNKIVHGNGTTVEPTPKIVF